MSLKYLFLLTAVIALVFGLGFLLVPEQTMALYGVESLTFAEQTILSGEILNRL